MVRSLKDPDSLIRQLYLYIYKYNGNFKKLAIDSITNSKLNISTHLTTFDSYLGFNKELNDERLKLFAIRHFNGDLEL